MAAKYDLKGIRRGNSYIRTFRFKDASNAPVDLTGSTIIFIATTSGGLPLRKTTADNSLAMPDPTSGEVTLSLTPAETRQLYVGSVKNKYEIERHINDEEDTILSGLVYVEQGVNDDGD